MEAIEDKAYELETALTDLSRLLVAEETLSTSMTRIANLAVAAVPNCDACSVSQAHAVLAGSSRERSSHRVITRVASLPIAETISRHEYECNEGPCLQAIGDGEFYKIDNISNETRWPAFVARAEREGLMSCMAVPLRVDGSIIGAMNMYALRGTFSERDVSVGRQFGEQASVTFANALAYQASREMVENLRIALESRDVIGQAKGIIMERDRCTSERAFEALRALSQRQNLKVRDLAQEIVETGAWSLAVV